MIRQLYQIFIRDTLSVKMLRRSKKQRNFIKFIGGILTVVIIALIIASIFYGLNINELINVIPINIGNVILVIGMFASFIFSIIAAISFFFSSCYLDKNLDNYLTLPIKTKDFTISKILVTYRNTLFVAALVMIPTILVYLFIGDISFLTIIFSLLYTLTMPIILIYTVVLILSTILLFINRMKNKNIAKRFLYTITTIFLIGIYLFFVLSLSYNPSGFLNILLELQSIIKILFAYPLWFIRVIANEQYLYLVNIILYLAACLLVQFYFERIYFKSSVGFNSEDIQQAKNKSKIKIGNHSVFRWFLLKESKEIFKTPVYFLNIVLGNIILIVVFLIAIFYNYFTLEESSLVFVNEYLNNMDITYLLLIVYAIATFSTLFNLGAASTFSRDAKNFSLVKTLPLKYNQALLGKTCFYFLLDFISIAIFMIVPLIFFNFSFVEIIICFLVLLLVSLATIFIPVCIDLLFPTMNWESQTAVIKRSKSTNITAFLSIGFSFIVIGSGAYLLITELVTPSTLLTIITIFYIILLIVMIIVFNKLSKRVYLKY